MRFRFTVAALVFPARAGMSRVGELPVPASQGFPRPRGDEPKYRVDWVQFAAFSPPARG